MPVGEVGEDFDNNSICQFLSPLSYSCAKIYIPEREGEREINLPYHLLLEDFKAAMEPKLERLGRSLLVPCVQELAKESLAMIPARYVRPDQDPPLTSYTTSGPEVPILDMENLLSGNQMELKKLDSACKEWGFFQVLYLQK